MEVKMEVIVEVKMGVKKDNTFGDNKSFVLFNSLFNSPLKTKKVAENKHFLVLTSKVPRQPLLSS